MDSRFEEITQVFENMFSGPEWELIFLNSIDQGIETFKERYDIDIIILGYDMGEDKSVRFLEFVRSIDENVAVFFMDDKPSETFSAYDAHRFEALPYFIHKDELNNNPDLTAAHIINHYNLNVAKLCTPKMMTEYGNLRSVLVHTPSEEVERIDPDNLGHYLFESLPSMSKMIEQHQQFIKTIKDMGKRPLTPDIRMLLYDIIRLASVSERRSIIESTMYLEEFCRVSERFGLQNLTFSPLLSDKIDEISSWDAKEITDIILCGLNVADFLGDEASASMYTRQECQIIEPVPNTYFMRDPGFVLGETFFISRMYRKIRRRETNILRQVVSRHPQMKYVKSNRFDLDDWTQDAVAIEGGDTMCIAPGNYAIGESERTSRASIRKVAEHLFKNSLADKLFQPLIPPKRAFIHLDTVCSLAGADSVIVHNEAFSAYSETLLWTPEVIRRKTEPLSLGMNFVDVLKYEFGKEVIQAAGGGSKARLEQFDDATNVFMVNPETPMVYSRNIETNKILEEKGFKAGKFEGSDLVMGRGGARCMTMPLHRD